MFNQFAICDEVSSMWKTWNYCYFRRCPPELVPPTNSNTSIKCYRGHAAKKTPNRKQHFPFIRHNWHDAKPIVAERHTLTWKARLIHFQGKLPVLFGSQGLNPRSFACRRRPFWSHYKTSCTRNHKHLMFSSNHSRICAMCCITIY